VLLKRLAQATIQPQVDGFIPFTKPGDILGHGPMGIVEEVGSDVDQTKLEVGDRVIVSFPIGWGNASIANVAFGAAVTIPIRTLRWLKNYTATRQRESLDIPSSRADLLGAKPSFCECLSPTSIAGVYGEMADRIPLGALMNKGLSIKTGQPHVHRYVPKLFDHIRNGDIDPSFL
jgi:threonine dehydrogenase-like Zn-dependent dehydrogenase